MKSLREALIAGYRESLGTTNDWKVCVQKDYNGGYRITSCLASDTLPNVVWQFSGISGYEIYSWADG